MLTETINGLLAAAIENPHDVDLRRVLCDAYEDAKDFSRATFMRTQLELSTYGDYECPKRSLLGLPIQIGGGVHKCLWCALRRIETDSILTFASTWSKPLVGALDMDFVHSSAVSYAWAFMYRGTNQLNLGWRNGLIEEVVCSYRFAVARIDLIHSLVPLTIVHLNQIPSPQEIVTVGKDGMLQLALPDLDVFLTREELDELCASA